MDEDKEKNKDDKDDTSNYQEISLDFVFQKYKSTDADESVSCICMD